MCERSHLKDRTKRHRRCRRPPRRAEWRVRAGGERVHGCTRLLVPSSTQPHHFGRRGRGRGRWSLGECVYAGYIIRALYSSVFKCANVTLCLRGKGWLGVHEMGACVCVVEAAQNNSLRPRHRYAFSKSIILVRLWDLYNRRHPSPHRCDQHRGFPSLLPATRKKKVSASVAATPLRFTFLFSPPPFFSLPLFFCLLIFLRPA